MYTASIHQAITSYIVVRIVMIVLGVGLWFAARAPNDKGCSGNTVVVFRRMAAVGIVVLFLSEIIAAASIHQSIPQYITSTITNKERYTCGHSACYRIRLAHNAMFQIDEATFNHVQAQECITIQFYTGTFWFASATFIERLTLAHPEACAVLSGSARFAVVNHA